MVGRSFIELINIIEPRDPSTGGVRWARSCLCSSSFLPYISYNQVEANRVLQKGSFAEILRKFCRVRT